MKQFTSFFLVIVVFCSIFSISSLAANVCSSVSGSGNCESSTSFEATTGKGWIRGQTITLTGTKGTYRLEYAPNPDKVHSSYGFYEVRVYDTKTGKTTISDWRNKKSIKIKLPEKNRKYIITVKARSASYIEQNTIQWAGFRRWTKAPTWSASRTANVTYCK